MRVPHKSRGSMTVEAVMVTPLLFGLIVLMVGFMLLPLWSASSYTNACKQAYEQPLLQSGQNVWETRQIPMVTMGDGTILSGIPTTDGGVLKRVQYAAGVTIPVVDQTAWSTQTVRVYPNAKTALLYALYDDEE